MSRGGHTSRLVRALARRLAGDQRGIMMMELVIAMAFLSIAVGAMIGVFASTMISLRNAGIEGTALTLAESQMESYKTLPYADMKIDSATIPASGTDPYNTASTEDATIPSPGGQVAGGSVGTSACAAPTRPLAECAVQTIAGPDNRSYRVETYVHESGGLKSVTVVARIIENGVPGKIKARASTKFDPAFTVQS
ncbi:MAG: type IV pilus modification PilV family protein [Gaiella sp.]